MPDSNAIAAIAEDSGLETESAVGMLGALPDVLDTIIHFWRRP
jgi:hypothetical protein